MSIVKPKTQRYARFLKKRESKVFENDKNTLLIKGSTANQKMQDVLMELFLLKKPNAIFFRNRLQKTNVKHDRPFEDHSSVEFLCEKNDCSLFAFGSHNKKRPQNLILGRMFNHQLLDMIELGVDNIRLMSDVKGTTAALGSKPCLSFSGQGFENDFHMMRLKSLLIDFFRGPVVENIQAKGLEHVIQFTAIDGKVKMRGYKVNMMASGTKIPRIELADMGPNMDFTLRRSHLAADELMKQACRQPKEATANKKNSKNKKTNMFGATLGQVHMDKTDLNKLQTRKMKALKRPLPDDYVEDEQPAKMQATYGDDDADEETTAE